MRTDRRFDRINDGGVIDSTFVFRGKNAIHVELLQRGVMEERIQRAKVWQGIDAD